MFAASWTWLLPLLGAVLVFSFVLLTTPPGFGAIGAVLFGSPRGAVADAVAYTLGSASSLALVTLVVLALITSTIEFARRRSR
jgi:hypothetical protein